MDYKELIDRYVYAVGKRLPYKIREDIEQEIKTLIYDMLEERCGELPASEKDVRVVLAELGKPEELAEHYSPDKDKCLIGQPYYGKYKIVMKIVFASVIIGMFVAGGVDTIINIFLKKSAANVADYSELIQFWDIIIGILGWFGSTMFGMMTSFAIVTGLFAFFQWKQIRVEDLSGENWESTKRPVRQKKKSEKTGAVAGMVLTIVFLIVFLFAPQIMCVFFEENGTRLSIPVLNIALVKSLWYFPVGFCLLGLARDGMRYFDGSHTARTVIVSGICDGLTLLLSIVWLTRYDMINPVLIRKLPVIFSQDEGIVISVFANFQLFFLAVLTLALVMDFGEAVWKFWKYRKETCAF